MKCYLLLRENVESGPFTLAQMKTQNLLPTDLIWIEGSSQSWRFPYEITELAPYVQQVAQKEKQTFSETETKEPEPKRVFVALPPQYQKEKQTFYAAPVYDEVAPLESAVEIPLESLEVQLESQKKKSKFHFPVSKNDSRIGWMAAVFVGLLAGAFLIKKMVDHMDERGLSGVATAALPATNLPQTGAEDKTYRNALATEVVPVDTTAAEKPKKEKKVNLKKLVLLTASNYKKGVFGGIQDLKLKVENNSNQILDKVTIEVTYLKPNGDVINTENHYVRAVAPKSSKYYSVPRSTRGVDVKYKITKIQANEQQAAMRDL